MDTLEVSTTRAADMVKQVLTFARGVHGQRSPIQVRHVLKDVEKIIGETLLRAIRVHSDIPGDLWIVNADGTQLHQLFMNLCVNARDAMSGRGEIRISARNVVIDETRKQHGLELQPGSYIAVDVKDSGSGIPPGVIEKIFEPFFTTKDAGKGTGLGLSTVQSIVRSHGGFMEVQTEIDRGTTFTVYLPSATSKTAEALVADRQALPMGNGEVVLIVDDEAAIRDIARATLEAYGYRVLAASNGEEGLRLLAQHGDEIQVIVSDMNMPGMSGDSMIQQMRQQQAKLRVIATSGQLEREEEGGLRKPYTAEELLRALNQTLQRQANSR
jgi:CheY-like chemotaxis protein